MRLAAKGKWGPFVSSSLDFLELGRSLIRNARKERKFYSPDTQYGLWTQARLEQAGARDEFVGATGSMKENISGS